MDYSSGELTAIFVQLVIVLLIARRSYAMTQGVLYSGLRNAVLPGLLLFLWVVNELESLLLTPWAFPFMVVIDLAILAGTSVVFAPIAARMTTVSRPSSGVGSVRIGFSLAALFLAAFVLRLAIAVALFPSSLAFGGPPGGFPPLQQQIVLAVVDAIFSFSAGLALARSLGMRRAWVHAVVANQPAGPA